MNKKLITITCITLLASPSFMAAEDAENPDKVWKAVIGLGYINTTGNTRTESFANKNKLDFDWKTVQLNTKFNMYFANENNSSTAEEYFAEEKLKFPFHNNGTYGYQLGSWEKNRFANIDNRTTLGVGVGQKIIDSKLQSLDTEVGVQEVWEDQRNNDADRYSALRAFGEYIYNFTEESAFEQDLEYIKDFKSSEAYRITSLSAIRANLVGPTAIVISYEFKYNSDPPPATGKTDTKTLVSIEAKL